MADFFTFSPRTGKMRAYSTVVAEKMGRMLEVVKVISIRGF